MAELTREQLEEQLRSKEREVRVQLEHVYGLAKQQKAFDLLKEEFQTAVDRMSEKYAIQFSLIELDKPQLAADAYEERIVQLRDQYAQDVSVLAVALDEAQGIEIS